MWQEIIVGGCVAGAGLFLLWRWLPHGKKSSGCNTGCGSCATTGACATQSPGNTKGEGKS